MPLTQFAIVKATAKDKPLKLSDGGGLHLLVQPSGGKLWRFRYRFAGSENTVAFGFFPTVSLAQARVKREEARRLIADGTDPATKKKLDRIAAATAARPLRVKNFAALELGRHLVKAGQNWLLSVPAAETKTRQPLSFNIPERCCPGSSAIWRQSARTFQQPTLRRGCGWAKTGHSKVSKWLDLASPS